MNYKIFGLPAALTLLAAVAFGQQRPFSISGQIKGRDNAYIYLFYQSGESRVVDSSMIRNGKFSFAGKLDGPAVASVLMDRSGRNYDKYAQLYLVPAKMQLSIQYDRFDDARLTGSSVQAQADELKEMRAPIMARMKPLNEAYTKASTVYAEAMKAKKNEATLTSLKEAANAAKDAGDELREQLGKVDEQFMDKYPSSFVTASLLRYAASRLSYAELEKRYSKLASDVKLSSLGKEIEEEVEALKMGSPGATAFVFASKELRGEPLSLADFRGKYVLLDFWASWCVPCRKGNPHLLSLYAKYKPQGLEIIGVSDDDSNHEAWQKAVEKDGIGVWKHVLRGLKRVDGPQYYDKSASISDKYGIHTLPTKILVDPKGVIIGRYGGGGENDEAMDKKLSEIFGN
ncbi:MAG: redoxin domain-containing protein [Flavisolibacter sp.]